MVTAPGLTETVLYDTLMNYLVSMARTVEGAMNRALDSLVGLQSPATASLPGEVFLLEPRINEMEIVIDEHAIRLLRRGSFSDDEMRLIVAALKITNDLERIGDIAVNVAERVISLRELPGAELPDELGPMAAAVRTMVSKSLGALIFRNVDMATQVLESRRHRRSISRPHLRPTAARHDAGAGGGQPRPSIHSGDAPPGADRRPRHQHRRRHYFLGAWPGCAPRPWPGEPRAARGHRNFARPGGCGRYGGFSTTSSNASSIPEASAIPTSGTTAPAIENFHR